MEVLFLLYAFVITLSCLFNSTTAIKCNFRYSETDADYSESYVNHLLKRSKMSTQIANLTIGLSAFECDNDDTDERSLQKRFADSDGYESLCESTRRTIAPKMLPSAHSNQLVHVVNTKDFIQRVTTETCLNINKQCKSHPNFPHDYRCKQNYQTHTVKAVNPMNSQIYDETVYIPSSCECKVKLTEGEVESR